jgi:hypothetical protein
MPPVQLDGFLAALAELSTDDLDRVARALDAETVADEVDWWRATIAIDRAIRHARRTRQAARAATRATELVVRCGEAGGRGPIDPVVARVARAAADVARGLAAGPATAPIARLLLEPWAVVTEQAQPS